MKIFTYRFTYKKPFWIRKVTKSYVKVHKGTFMKLSDSHKISQEKQDFKISDVLITAWSRVQVLPGPPKKHEGFGLRASFLLIRTVPCSSGCESLCAACHRPACRLQGLYWAVRTWNLSSPNSSASLHPSAFFWISTVRDRTLATVMILP